ncbi:hypothetical protein [uncultured Psychroserpens sp.]|uniref:hypothetical protein n=1 Tax=uncultured Psychroserpens sp. TaxID=255436 RepID=UPI00261B2D6B|nr:hypothetical protein [uncultured Psychroserpens sp.]
MKNKILIFIVLIGLTILNFSCQKDDEVLNEQAQTRSVILETTSLSRTRHSINLKDFFKPTEGVKANNSGLLGRSSEAFFNDFVVDTSSVKYIEGPVSHSYTFALTANYDNPTLVQNLLLAKHNNMDSYVALLVTYSLTQNELEQLENGVYPSNYTNQPTFEEIDDLDQNMLGIAARICIEFTTTYTYEFPCTCCAVHADPSCNHPDVVSITVSEVGACSGDGGTGSGSSDGDGSSSGGGGGGIDWGGSEYSPYDPNDVENSGDLLAEGPLTQINVPARSLVREQMSNLLDDQDINFINNYPDLESAFNSFLRGNSDTFRYDFIDWSIDYLQYLYISSHSQVPGIPPTSPENAVIFDSIVNNPSSEIIDAIEGQIWENANLFPEDDDSGDEISDIVDYMSCFDLTQPAEITLYVDQPKPNSPDPYRITLNPFDPVDVGHTFIAIKQGTITRVLGYYPIPDTINPSNDPSENVISCASILRDDSDHEFDVSISNTNVTPTQLTNIYNSITGSEPTYNLNTYNCTDFGIDIINETNTNVPNTDGTWPRGGNGSNPGNLGQDIRGMTNLPSGVTTNTTGGTSVSNSGTCN